MTNAHSPGNEAKPVVRISVAGTVPENVVESISWGLEEEGIPVEIREVGGGPTVQLAKQAADASKLNVGICINGDSKKIVLHHRDLPKDRPLFELTEKDFGMKRLRTLGTNAARLVKGEPLVFEPGQERAGEPMNTVSSGKRELEKPAELTQDQMEALVARIVAEIINSESRGQT